jgi:hypothetical protein
MRIHLSHLTTERFVTECKVYTVEGMRCILEDVRRESVSLLLFLKSLQRLEVYEWDSSSAQPRQLFTCCLANASQDILTERRFMAAAAANAERSNSHQAMSAYVAIFESRMQKSSGQTVHRAAFQICQSFGGRSSNALATVTAE